MKTTISLPNDLFASADLLAERMGLSRSALIAQALAEFVAKNNAAMVTERLDAVHRVDESSLDASFRRAQGDSIHHKAW
jgi:predicted transcriptional regulator